MKKPQRVVIVGGGFAGLNCAKSLANDDRFAVTLIDRQKPPPLPTPPLSSCHRFPLRSRYRPFPESSPHQGRKYLGRSR